jgi:hypothetical protein
VCADVFIESPKGDDGRSQPTSEIDGEAGPKRSARLLPPLRGSPLLRKLCRLRYRPKSYRKKCDMLLRNTTHPVSPCAHANAVPIFDCVNRYTFGEPAILIIRSSRDHVCSNHGRGWWWCGRAFYPTRRSRMRSSRCGGKREGIRSVSHRSCQGIEVGIALWCIRTF